MSVLLPTCPRCGANDQWGLEAVMTYADSEHTPRRRYLFDAKRERFVIATEAPAPQAIANGYFCDGCQSVFRGFYAIDRAFDGVPSDRGFPGEEPLKQYNSDGKLVEKS